MRFSRRFGHGKGCAPVSDLRPRECGGTGQERERSPRRSTELAPVPRLPGTPLVVVHARTVFGDLRLRSLAPGESASRWGALLERLAQRRMPPPPTTMRPPPVPPPPF